MARYHLHLRDGTEELLDPEGTECPDMEGLRRTVLAAVRSCMSGDVLDGLLDFRFRLDAEDEAGNIVYTLPFKHAVNIIPES